MNDKFKMIRPVVLGIVINDNKLLVGKGYDKVKNQTYYRCLGGGIDFLEKSVDALKREFKEELNIDIIVEDYMGMAENIFKYEGKDGHEIDLMYKARVKDEDIKDEYAVLDEPECTVHWVDIADFKNGDKILYPVELIDML